MDKTMDNKTNRGICFIYITFLMKVQKYNFFSSKFKVPSSKFKVPSSKFQVQSSKFKVALNIKRLTNKPLTINR